MLQNNDGDDLAVTADGSFSFAMALADTSTYQVSVSTQPSSPSQTCTVSNGSGILGGATVNNVAVSCPPPQVSATVSASQPKVLSFSWNDVGADHYKLLKNPDGASGYSQVGADIIATNVDETIGVHLQDWVNASYIVQACNALGACTDSTSITTTMAMLDAIGYFKASNTDADDYFGISVALSADGSTLAVGADREESSATGINGDESDNSARNAGAVYLFSRAGSSWSQQAYIKASNTGVDNHFGISVSLSEEGDTLAVGADSKGAVYLFSRTGTSWSQQSYITPSNTDTDGFGVSVSLSADGNTLAVGADREDSAATGINGDESDNSASWSGAAYLFNRTDSSWNQLAYIKASNTAQLDRFGTSVALSADGDTLAVGAFSEESAATGINGDEIDNSAADAGAVYLFSHTGSSWSQQAYIKASNTDVNDKFGWNVALSAGGNTLAVGASLEGSAATGINGDENDNSADYAGAVYLFGRTGSSWSQQAYIKPSNTNEGDGFGRRITLSADGNTLAVGAYTEDSSAMGINGDESDNTATVSAGAAYLFSRTDSSWSQQAYIKASNTDPSDYFSWGIALSADGKTLAVGAIGEDSAATSVNGDSHNTTKDAGAVYLY